MTEAQKVDTVIDEAAADRAGGAADGEFFHLCKEQVIMEALARLRFEQWVLRTTRAYIRVLGPTTPEAAEMIRAKLSSGSDAVNRMFPTADQIRDWAGFK